jgi:probable addiction module antidote protein
MTTKKKLAPFNPADADDPSLIAAYISEALQIGDGAIIAKAIGDVAKAKGVAAMAAKVNLDRKSIYRIIKGGSNSRLNTVTALLRELGIKLVAEPMGPRKIEDYDQGPKTNKWSSV